MLVYLGTDLLAAWGLNLEFGVAGVVNFAYIVLVAAGAYLYAVFTLGPPAAMGGFQQYIIGGRLPAAAAVALAALICGGLGCLIGVTGLKRLRAQMGDDEPAATDGAEPDDDLDLAAAAPD
jgi:branched-subunit amino acid ABC-type transport system permease component